MKRIISLALVAIMIFALTVTLCSCEKETCTLCREEKFTMFMTEKENILGNKYYVCKDCEKELEEAADQIKDILKGEEE